MEDFILSSGPQIEFEVHVDRSIKERSPFFEIPVHVPKGVTRIDVSFQYDKSDDCLIDIGILDSTATDFPTRRGFRGWSGGARDHFFIARDSATPGYYAGEIPEGKWKILLGLYILPAEGASIKLGMKADDSARQLFIAPEPVLVRRDGAGWFRGDLHCHTYHSDAKGAPEVLAENARSVGLDFLAVTDHNTTTQWQYFSQQSTADLVFIPGMELTTYRGHANIFGLSEWIDFRIGGSEDLPTFLEEVKCQNAIFSVNHDKEPLVWDYEYPQMDCMEVYHGHWLTSNNGILQTYDRLLSEGRQISLIGGSDLHQPEGLRSSGPFGLGKPTTVIWAPYLDAGSVVSALKNGFGYVTESLTGPHLAFTVNDQPMGSCFKRTELDSNEINVNFEVRGAEGDKLRFVTEDGCIQSYSIPSEDWQERMTISVPGKFLRAEIEAENSRKRLINDLVDWYKDRPIYNRSQQPLEDAPRILRTLSNPVFFRDF